MKLELDFLEPVGDIFTINTTDIDCPPVCMIGRNVRWPVVWIEEFGYAPEHYRGTVSNLRDHLVKRCPMWSPDIPKGLWIDTPLIRDGRLVKAMVGMMKGLKLDFMVGMKEGAYLDSFCACWSRHVFKAAGASFCLRWATKHDTERGSFDRPLLISGNFEFQAKQLPRSLQYQNCSCKDKRASVSYDQFWYMVDL